MIISANNKKRMKKNRNSLKVIIATMALGVCVIGASKGAFATTTVKHGEINMDNSKGPTMSVMKVEYVGGGTWEHFFSGEWLCSYYFHNNAVHKTTVENSNTQITSGWVTPGTTARAEIIQTLTGNKCYWDVY